MRVGTVGPFRLGAIALALAPALLADPAHAQGTGVVAALSSTETGSVQGLATISSRLTSRKMRYRPYGDFGQGQFPSGFRESSELSNIVIYLESPSLEDSGGGRTYEIVQRDEVFQPHVLAVNPGDRVEFPNADDIYHNVFSLSGPATFDLGRYPRGESRSIDFSEPGVVRVFCQIHSDMSAVVLVLDNPFFAVPDEDGAFTIDGVPPGDYTLVAWHERIRPLRQPVRIVAGESTRLRVHLPDLGDEAGERSGR